MKKEKDDIGTNKEFLFDPYAAAYYSQFNDYIPGQQSIDLLLAQKNQKATNFSQPGTILEPVIAKSYYQEYCKFYGIQPPAVANQFMNINSTGNI